MLKSMKYFFLYLTTLVATSSFAQSTSSRVLVRNAGIVFNNHTISIKCYTNELYYAEGVNVYRKEGNGDWIKFNKNPIRKQEDVAKSEYEKDKDLYFFIPMINNAKKSDLKGLMLINILAKTFESQVFSRFLGIQIDDSTVKAGITYTYRVAKIKGGVETTLGESAIIVAGAETIEEPVKDISLLVDTNKVKFKWRHEEQRFYAVNVYRLNQPGQWSKQNREPVMISKYKDSLGRYQYPKVFYLDDSLAPGTYVYQLAGVDFFGKETKRSASFNVEVKDVIPPPPPESLEDSIRNLEVSLRWKVPVSKDISGIHIYRSSKSSGPYIRLNVTALSAITNTYKDKVLRAGPYYYYVSTIDLAGNESKSQTKFSEIHDIVPPLKPIGIVAKADSGRVVLTWQKSKESDLLGYRIFRTINKNNSGKFVLINSQPIRESVFVDKLPINAKNKFLYKIVAIDSSYNKSEASDIATIQMRDIIPPVKPYINKLNVMDNRVAINWIPNKDADLLGYEVYRSINDAPFTKVNSLPIGIKETIFTDNNAPAGSLSYYLIALDSANNKSLP